MIRVGRQSIRSSVLAVHVFHRPTAQETLIFSMGLAQPLPRDSRRRATASEARSREWQWYQPRDPLTPHL